MNQTLWTTDAPEDDPNSSATKGTVDVPTPSEARERLHTRFHPRIHHNSALDRTLVSYQANKNIPFYGWFKYREGFSESLVTYLLRHLHPQPGILLDPFAGSGSALFASRSLGWETHGIEVLPVGIYAMNARMAADRVNVDAFHATVEHLMTLNFAPYAQDTYAFRHIPITRGAYPPDEETQLIGYITYCHTSVADEDMRELLLYAAFCILEEISYTRKDGQYLRWDARSGRSQGKKPFNKGRIFTFRDALYAKLQQIAGDLGARPAQPALFSIVSEEMHERPDIHLHEGSCLTILPTLPEASFDFVLTSPPYANRYDYTRTYALELVYLGCDSEQVKSLRQNMLSCTVENRDKRAQLQAYYAQLGREADFETIDSTFEHQAALQEVLGILDRYRESGALNNENIARLVRNYFYEMCFVIFELGRVLKDGGIISMVNDNVRYAGEEVPVDLILSDFAETFGLTAQHIWTLGRGKGNSSQQMGSHGRTELRKCVYVWEKQPR